MLEGLKQLDGHSEISVQMALAEVASCARGEKTFYQPLLDVSSPRSYTPTPHTNPRSRPSLNPSLQPFEIATT